MSELQVKIREITNVRPHPNADRLDLADAGSWPVVVKRDEFKNGDLVIHIPPDTILPAKLHEFIECTKYCAELPKGYEIPKMGTPQTNREKCLYGDSFTERPSARRVKAARLRGEPSYGLIMSTEKYFEYLKTQPNSGFWNKRFTDIEEGEDVAEFLGVAKWEPPIKATQGDIERDLPQFHKYTSIENYYNYPDLIPEGTEVVATIKTHGTNGRIGFMPHPNDDGELKDGLVAGSHNTRRKSGLYWEPTNWYPQIGEMLKFLYKKYQEPVILYFEIFGQGIQDMDYGTTRDIVAFDISVDGKYMDYDDFKEVCDEWDIPVAQAVYRGPFNKQVIKDHTDGPALEGNPDQIKCKFKGREGIVIKPVKEMFDKLNRRVIVKSVSVDYLERRSSDSK